MWRQSGSAASAAAGPPWKKTAEIVALIEYLLAYDTGGDPISGVKWSRRTTAKVAMALGDFGITVSANTVARLLAQMGCSFRVNQKQLATDASPDRNEQFLYIGDLRDRFQRHGWPIISVDTTKRELVGTFKNPGARWDRSPRLINDHDFRWARPGSHKGDSVDRDSQQGLHRAYRLVDTMGIPILQGRSFHSSDAASAGNLAIVNETLANTHWQGGNPIGQRLRPAGTEPWFTVIGVANVKQTSIDQPVGAEVYVLLDQLATNSPTTWLAFSPATMHVVTRTALPLEALAPMIASVFRQVDPAVPVARLREMDEVFALVLAAIYVPYSATRHSLPWAVRRRRTARSDEIPRTTFRHIDPPVR